jgi:hypothetical protein
MRNTLSNSNSQKHRASSARSFGRECLTAKFFGVRRRALAARGDGRSSIANLEQFITSFCAFVIPSGYRGLASVLQNPPCCCPDLLHSSPFATASFVSDHERSEGFLAWVAKNLSHSNINWLRSAKL